MDTYYFKYIELLFKFRKLEKKYNELLCLLDSDVRDVFNDD